MLDPDEAAALVGRAASGDSAAWSKLVAAYGALVWTVARSHRLDAAEAADVSQTTWLRLVQHVDTLREPARVGAWLATTARRECLNCIRKRKGETWIPDAAELPEEPAVKGPESLYLDQEQAELVRAAVSQLPPRCRELLGLLMADDPMDYRAIAEALSVPIGSIGPTRGRCLKKLRAIVEGLGITYDGGADQRRLQ